MYREWSLMTRSSAHFTLNTGQTHCAWAQCMQQVKQRECRAFHEPPTLRGEEGGREALNLEIV
jgi:hypothetical protein